MKIKDSLYKELKARLLEELEGQKQVVEVTSAYLLSEEELDHITSKLVGRSMKATNVIDPEIIAGVVVRMGSKIIDLSLRGEIEAIGEYAL